MSSSVTQCIELFTSGSVLEASNPFCKVNEHEVCPGLNAFVRVLNALPLLLAVRRTPRSIRQTRTRLTFVERFKAGPLARTTPNRPHCIPS